MSVLEYVRGVVDYTEMTQPRRRAVPVGRFDLLYDDDKR